MLFVLQRCPIGSSSGSFSGQMAGFGPCRIEWIHPPDLPQPDAHRPESPDNTRYGHSTHPATATVVNAAAPESPQIVSEILSPELPTTVDAARARITAAWSRDETEAINELLAQASLPPAERELVLAAASDLVARVRAKADDQSAVESFMREYDLSSEEGVLLMCVAEALLRIPDAETADKLIRDKLGDANWKKHVGASESLFVNASTWGLMLTGRTGRAWPKRRDRNFVGAFAAAGRTCRRTGDPPGRAPGDAHHGPPVRHGPHDRRGPGAVARRRNTPPTAIPMTCSARPRSPAPMPSATCKPIATRSSRSASSGPWPRRARCAVDLDQAVGHPSALRRSQRVRDPCRTDPARARTGAAWPRRQGIGMTIDAEEADRLELSLDLIGAVFARSIAGRLERIRPCRAGLPETRAVRDRLAGRDWRARPVAADACAWSRAPTGIPRSSARRSEGLVGYPVFTRKPNTDVSYLACARQTVRDRRRTDLPAVRHAQCAHDCSDPTFCPRSARTSTSACTAWATISTTK